MLLFLLPFWWCFLPQKANGAVLFNFLNNNLTDYNGGYCGMQIDQIYCFPTSGLTCSGEVNGGFHPYATSTQPALSAPDVFIKVHASSTANIRIEQGWFELNINGGAQMKEFDCYYNPASSNDCITSESGVLGTERDIILHYSNVIFDPAWDWYLIMNPPGGGNILKTGANAYSVNYNQRYAPFWACGATTKAEAENCSIPSAASISIIQPENGTTTTNTEHLNFWGVGITLNSTSTLDDGLTALIQVKYCDLDTGCPAYLIDNYLSRWYSAGSGSIYFLKNYELDNALWQAQAFFYSGESPTSTLLASSATSTFTITGGITVPTSTQVFAPACNFTTSSFLADPIGNIQQAICNAASFLFYPSTPQQATIGSEWGNIKTSVAQKPPFGYFTSVATALQQGTTTQSTTTIVNASTAAAFALFLTPWKTIATVLLWVLFLFWLFNKIRKFHF